MTRKTGNVPANWAIVENGGVSDRFFTFVEARTALHKGEYSPLAEVKYVRDPGEL